MSCFHLLELSPSIDGSEDETLSVKELEKRVDIGDWAWVPSSLDDLDMFCLAHVSEKKNRGKNAALIAALAVGKAMVGQEVGSEAAASKKVMTGRKQRWH
jgi:hypothetical protein